MNSREADTLARCMAELLAAGSVVEAYAALEPVLGQRTPFRLLDRITKIVGAEQRPVNGAFMDRIAEDGNEGGWVIIGGMLREEYARQPVAVIAECRRYIVTADKWYGADILGERVPGPALVDDYGQSMALLAPWRSDANRWVRRSAGVATHFWAKRSRGDPALEGQACGLLDFLRRSFKKDPAFLQHGHTLGDIKNIRNFMAHNNSRKPKPSLVIRYHAVYDVLTNRVQSSCGLIKQHYFRIGHKSPCKSYSFLHPA